MKVLDFLKKILKDEIARPIIVLLAICIVISLALSVTNAITEGRIAKLDKQSANDTMKSILKAETFEEVSCVDDKVSFVYNVGIKEGKTIGYIFVNFAKGYGGEVKVMTAVDTAGKILNVAILDASNETPGLGQNVTKHNFVSQFKNKSKEITVKKNGADGKKMEIDAVTGATISSKAVTKAVNEALKNFDLINATANEEGKVESSEG